MSLRADGYADNTVKAYQKAVRSLADWLAEHHPEVGPVELERQHIRGWLVEVRETHSSNTARGWFAGVRHFCRWLQSEGETDQDATAGIRTPAPGDPETPVLSDEDLRDLLATCAGTDFTARRDAAIIMLFLDGGLRLSELADLQVTDVDLRDRIVYVMGKASRRSGPRHRAVPLGVKAARALDRYLRERRRHPYADTPRLWLGSRGRPALAADGVDAMLKRRGADAGIADLHPHAFRHTWAHAFRAAGGNEGDLMLLGGWRSRAMLDRYGKTPPLTGVFGHFRRQWEERGFGPWAAIDKRTGRWLGEIGLNELPSWPGLQKIEVGWELHPSVWGRGLATEGGRVAVRHGFEVVGLERIISVTRADHAASRRVMEKCGLTFREQVVHKAALVVWYAIDRADWQAGQAAAGH